MRILVTDCGSTTTKALLFEELLGTWQTIARGEAPTTVEDPLADVTIGVENAIRAIEEQTKRKIFDDRGKLPPFLKTSDNDGIDLYLSTSSAGGGLQMLVLAVTPKFSVDAAVKAALRAGAIVRDTIHYGTAVSELEHISRLRSERPDIVLVAGGVESGDTARTIELAELLRAANPKPRFGKTRSLPVLFAGNSKAFPLVQEILHPISEVRSVPNVLPALGEENLAPARDEIHEIFLSHVMSHAPGYSTLLSWVNRPVLPTPSACGIMIENIAEEQQKNVLCVDIGGATTDIFTCFHTEEGERLFHRSVSANFGMSYSIGNVLQESSVNHIRRWLSQAMSDEAIVNAIKNKMVRPSTIPETEDELELEQAVCREALRLSLVHHNQLAVRPGANRRRSGIAEIFTQNNEASSLLEEYGLDILIGSGGVLSHAPNRLDAARMMLEGFSVHGVVSMAVDSVFMLPHLGVLSTVHREAAQQILHRDCLVPICAAIRPMYRKSTHKREKVASIECNGSHVGDVIQGELVHVQLAQPESFQLDVVPCSALTDFGNGYGKRVSKKMLKAPYGLLLDGRAEYTLTNTRAKPINGGT